MQEEENKRKRKLLFFILLFILAILAFIAYLFFTWKGRPISPTPDTNGFSPIDRDSTYKPPQEPDIDYAKPLATSTPEPVRPAPSPIAAPTYTPSIPEPTPTPRTEPTFVLPSQPTKKTVYEQPAVYTPPQDTTYSPASYQPLDTTYTPDTTKPKQTPPVVTPGTPGKVGFWEIDKQIWGVVTGLGWTQLLGDVGEQVFDMLYSMSPNGGTQMTWGQFIPGGQSTPGTAGGIAAGGLAGGFGGGGGGTQNFGGQVTQTQQCTCSGSTMVTIKDVRGQTISLIYQPGASTLYANYNIYSTNVNVLGTYVSGGVCLMVGEPCETTGNPQGTIQQIGTSSN